MGACFGMPDAIKVNWFAKIPSWLTWFLYNVFA